MFSGLNFMQSILDKHFGLVVKRAKGMKKNTVCDVNDYIQVGLLALYRSEKKYNKAFNVQYSYYDTCARNAMYKEYNKLNKYGCFSLAGLSYKPNIIDEFTVHELLDKLSEAERNLVKLRYFYDINYSDISRITGVPRKKAKILIDRALVKMRNNIQ